MPDTAHLRQRAWAAAVAPARVALDAYHDPIDAIRDEHLLQRACFVALEALAATDKPQPSVAEAILATLKDDTPTHIADEEQSLFPRLRARAEPDDDMDTLLTTLSAEHSSTRTDMADLVVLLQRLATGAMPDARGRQLMLHVAATEKKHLVLENAVLLPLAAARLDEADKRDILAEMRERRIKSAEGGRS